MHIQLTTRCNMTCGHCSFACTEQGTDITFEHFKMALEIKDDPTRPSPRLALGGGEPTIHPEFWKMVDYAISKGLPPTITTNGKARRPAIELAKRAQRGELTAILSLDEWHDPISQEVLDAFTFDGHPANYQGLIIPKDMSDSRRIRTLPASRLFKMGRWTQENAHTKGRCSWPRYFIIPTGEIKWCGCESALTIGHVETGIDQKLIADRFDPALGCLSLQEDGKGKRKAAGVPDPMPPMKPC